MIFLSERSSGFAVRKRDVMLAFLACFLLSGCYSSEKDLVAGNATKITAIDSLFVHNEAVYYWFRDKLGSDFLCAVRLRSEFGAPCAESLRYPIKLERTQRGNYIVQVGRKTTSGYRYNYALWLRSESKTGTVGFPCVMWLGDGIVSGVLSLEMSALRMRWEGDPVFQQLEQQLLEITGSNTSVNRNDLLRIVAVYEQLLFDPMTRVMKTGNDSALCLNERVPMIDEAVVLERDNRHLKDFE
jgi:hypothetical protein